MKRFIAMICSVLLGCCLLAGCGKSENPDPQNPQTPGSQTPPAETLPTAAEVVSAIRSTTEAPEQNYDFKLNLAGSVSICAIQSPNANATYDCQYRFNSDTDALQFKRVTSGILLYDSTEYIYSQGDSRITVKMNEKNEVKKEIVNYKDTELHLLNLPFSSLIGSLEADDISDIAKSGSGYTAKIKISPENPALSKICGLIGKMDTSISLKGATFTNPVSGLDFTFSLSGGKLSGYTVKTTVSFPVKAASAQLGLTYTQTANSAAIQLPAVTGFVTDKTEIGNILGEIEGKINELKASEVYSLDFEAVNEMDPGATTLATKDSLESRLYKNGTTFNNSYKYHSHHEEQGKESYSFTVGNIQDGTVYLVSRKGKNSYDPAPTLSLDTQFTAMTELFRYTSAAVDCLKQTTSGDTTTYTIYLSDDSIATLPESISAMLNKNTADGIVPVENYFNSEDHTIKEATFTVVVKAGKLDAMTLETEIKYNPTAGDYTENNVTLNNTLTLTVDRELDKAQGYEAPEKAEPNLLGVGGLKNIL